MKIAALLLITAISLTQPAFAADIARDVRVGGNALDVSDGGYFEIGIGTGYFRSPLVEDVDKDPKRSGDYLEVIIGGEYRYKGLFIEAAHGTSDGLNLGYNFWRNESWTVDFLAVSGNLVIGDSDDEDIANLSELERNDELLNSFRIHQGTGFRATRYFKDYIFQFRLVSDITNSHGAMSTARIGKSWQMRNWNLHSILTTSYASAAANQYFYGVTGAQATTLFPEYIASSSLTFSAEVGVTYPLNQHWVFRSTTKFNDLSSDSKKSPLIKRNNIFVFSLALSYVF